MRRNAQGVALESSRAVADPAKARQRRQIVLDEVLDREERLNQAVDVSVRDDSSREENVFPVAPRL